MIKAALLKRGNWEEVRTLALRCGSTSRGCLSGRSARKHKWRAPIPLAFRQKPLTKNYSFIYIFLLNSQIALSNGTDAAKDQQLIQTANFIWRGCGFSVRVGHFRQPHAATAPSDTTSACATLLNSAVRSRRCCHVCGSAVLCSFAAGTALNSSLSSPLITDASSLPRLFMFKEHSKYDEMVKNQHAKLVTSSAHQAISPNPAERAPTVLTAGCLQQSSLRQLLCSGRAGLHSPSLSPRAWLTGGFAFVLTPTKMISHFENTRGITTKTGLIRSLTQFYKQLEPASTSSPRARTRAHELTNTR